MDRSSWSSEVIGRQGRRELSLTALEEIMRIIPVLGIFLFLAPPAMASDYRVTFYLDGARVEREVSTVRESMEVPLPAAMNGGSLRIKPLDGCRIDRVVVVPAQPSAALAREMARLAERRAALGDRMKALEAREAIFKAAAKSQSGKAPRKTKTNPEPLAAVRQGTEYAISQLEEVYRVRRRAVNEMQSVEARLSTLKNEGNVGGSVAKVRLARKGGRVAVSYICSDLKWAPVYDFRLDKAGEVNVVQRAVIPQTEKGAAVSVVPATFAEAVNEAATPVSSDKFPQVFAFTLPVEREQFSAAPLSSLVLSFRNRLKVKLPAGEASCYRRGEYLGRTAFGGALPDEMKELAFGR